MANTFVMTLYKRVDEVWKQSAVIVNESFTEQEWQEKVIGAKDFFAELGGTETHPDERTVQYIDSTKQGKTIYQLQDTKERQKNIDKAVIKVLSAFTPNELMDIFKDDSSEMRFTWQGETAFLNQTSAKELEAAIERNMR